MTRRARLTPREREALYTAQNGLCALSGEPLIEGQIDEEHSVAVELGGPAKPDRLVNRGAHKVKTFGRKGESKNSSDGNGDIQRIAKIKRIQKKLAKPIADHAGRVLPSPKLQSRGFQGHLKFNGERVWRS